MRSALTVLAFVASLFVTTIVTFFVVLVLAGPHAGILPQPLEVVVLLAGWVAVFVLPVLTARAVWRRRTPLGPTESQQGTDRQP